ncbi:hypothetical protein F4680DRAFT_405494 [Xylaria scruposa]|nr:hypothetical protein F4680DRAFT_405494 [Xylaria scruposa]
MWRILTGFGLLEHRKEEETIQGDEEITREEETGREDDEDSSDTSDLTNLTPPSTDSSSGDNPVPLNSIPSLPPPVLLVPTRNTIVRCACRGSVYLQRHQATKDNSRKESRQYVPGRQLRPCSGVTVPQPAFSLPPGGDAEDIDLERGSVLGDAWLRVRVEKSSTPSSLSLLSLPLSPPPLTDRNHVVDPFVSDSPAHYRSSEPQSEAFQELSDSSITFGRDDYTSTASTITNNEFPSPSPSSSPPRKPATKSAKPRPTHGLAMARAAGHLSIVDPHCTPPLPRGPPRSDNRDARADPMAIVSSRRQEYPERDRHAGPWRDDQREGRAYSRPEIGPGLARDRLWFHQDIRKGYVDRVLRQFDCDRDLMEERMDDSVGTGEKTLVWRQVPRSGSFGPGWVFLDPQHRVHIAKGDRVESVG